MLYNIIYGVYKMYNSKLSYIALEKFNLKFRTKHAKQPLEQKNRHKSFNEFPYSIQQLSLFTAHDQGCVFVFIYFG